MLGISCKWIKEERRMAKAEDLALEQSLISSSSLAEMQATRKRNENSISSNSNNNMVFVESIGATVLQSPSQLVNRQQSSNKTPRVSQSVDDTQETKTSTTTPIHEALSVSFKSTSSFETQLEQQKEKKES